MALPVQEGTTLEVAQGKALDRLLLRPTLPDGTAPGCACALLRGPRSRCVACGRRVVRCACARAGRTPKARLAYHREHGPRYLPNPECARGEHRRYLLGHLRAGLAEVRPRAYRLDPAAREPDE